MNPGFPKRAMVATRGYQPQWGGDGRYLYIPNRADRTISVIDTATDTVVTTISLTSYFAGPFDGAWYRSEAKQVIAISGSLIHVVIDADPNSASFNTVIDNYTIAQGYYSFNQACVYDANYDMMRSGTRWGFLFKVKDRDYSGASPAANTYHSISNYDCYFAFSNLIQGGGGSAFSYLASIDLNEPVIQFRNTSISAFSGITFRIGRFIYQLQGSLFKHAVIENNTKHVNLSFVSSIAVAVAPQCYDSKNNKLFCTGGTGGEGYVVNLNTFTGLGTVQARSRASNEANNAFKAIYSPYSGKVYVYTFNNSVTTPGCDRVHIYDLSLPLASCYVGFINVGNNCATNRIFTNPAAMNRLYTTEFPF